ncbi:MAG TPA: hypothetical protein VF731_02455 [Solirubrobacterales bacterium]
MNYNRPGGISRSFGRASLICVLGACIAMAISGAASAETPPPIGAVAVPPSVAPPAELSASPVAQPLRVADPAAFKAAKQRAERRYQAFESRRAAATGTSSGHPQTAIFGGLDVPGIDATGQGVTPPDTTGAVGPNDYLEMVNSEIGRYSKSSLGSIESLPENSFVGSAAGICDGQIQWDQEGQRWIYTALDCNAPPGSQQLYFGWSRTTSPALTSTNWCRWVAGTGHSLEDYPKLGHDNTQILIGTNAFQDETEAYLGSLILTMPKPAPGVSTCPASLTVHGHVAGTDFTPVPANIADSSAHGYVTALHDPTHLTLYEVGENGSGEATFTTKTVAVPEYEIPAEVPQPGTSEVLDSSDTRLTQSVATTDPATGQEGIWTEHTVAGPGGGPSVVRWYELSPGASVPRQTGTVAGPGGTFAFNAAISPTADGSNAGVVYNTGGASAYASLRAKNRHASTPLGAMEEEVELGTSVGADEDFSCDYNPVYNPDEVCRWGDYAGASPDPANSHLIWATGELTTLPWEFEEPQWGTRNVALDISPPPPPPLPPAPAPAPAPTPPPGPIVHRRIHCHKGFKKRRVHGKIKCVKVHHHHRHHHH